MGPKAHDITLCIRVRCNKRFAAIAEIQERAFRRNSLVASATPLPAKGPYEKDLPRCAEVLSIFVIEDRVTLAQTRGYVGGEGPSTEGL